MTFIGKDKARDVTLKAYPRFRTRIKTGANPGRAILEARNLDLTDKPTGRELQRRRTQEKWLKEFERVINMIRKGIPRTRIGPMLGKSRAYVHMLSKLLPEEKSVMIRAPKKPPEKIVTSTCPKCKSEFQHKEYKPRMFCTKECFKSSLIKYHDKHELYRARWAYYKMRYQTDLEYRRKFQARQKAYRAKKDLDPVWRANRLRKMAEYQVKYKILKPLGLTKKVPRLPLVKN